MTMAMHSPKLVGQCMKCAHAIYLDQKKKKMEKMGVFGCESGNVKFP